MFLHKRSRKSNDSVQLRWTYVASIYQRNRQYVVFRDEALGTQKQLIIRRDPLFFQACDKEYFYADGIGKTFRSEKKLVRTLCRGSEDRVPDLEWELIEPGPILRRPLRAFKKLFGMPLAVRKGIVDTLTDLTPREEALGEAGTAGPV